MWRAYKNPEFWLRFRKQDWVYALVRNPLGRFVQIVIPLRDIRDDGEFTMFKDRKYFWKAKDDRKATLTEEEKKAGITAGDSEPLTLGWRFKKPAAIFDYYDPFPQKWVRGNSLTSITDPGMIDDITDLRILKLMMNADSLTKLLKVALGIAVIGILASVGIAFGLFQVNATVAHQACIMQHLDNSTAAQVLCK